MQPVDCNQSVDYPHYVDCRLSVFLWTCIEIK